MSEQERATKLIVLVLIGGSTVINASLAFSIPFLTLYLKDKTQLSMEAIGIIVATSSFTWSFLGFFGGAISDKLGQLNSILIALFLSAVAFLGLTYSNQPYQYFLSNSLVGVGKALFDPSWKSLISVSFQKDRRVKAFNLRYIFGNLGYAIGPAFALFFIQKDISFAFLITGIIYFSYGLVFLYLFFKYKKILRRINSIKSAFSIRKSINIMLNDKRIMVYLIGGISSTIIFSQLQSTLPIIINENFKNGIVIYSYMLIARASLLILVQLILYRIISLLAPATWLIISSLFYGLTYLLFLFLLTKGFWILTIGIVLLSIAETLTTISSLLFLDTLSNLETKGVYFGAGQLKYIGMFLGPALGGFLLEHLGSQWLFVVMILFSLIGALSFFSYQSSFVCVKR